MSAAFALAASATLFGQATTTVSDTFVGPDGAPVQLRMTVTPTSTFTSPEGLVVPVFSTATVNTNGSFTIKLVPNTGTTPAGSSYRVDYTLNGIRFHETWVVPQSSIPVGLRTVRTLLPPPLSSISPAAAPGDLYSINPSLQLARVAANSTPIPMFLSQSSSAVPSWVQPTFSQLAGTLSASQVPSLSALNGTLNDAQLGGAYSGVGVCASNQFAVSLVRNAVPACAPAVSASDAPSNQFATGISAGGALSYSPAVQASAAPVNQFATAISPAGALSYAQPGFGNLTGTATDTQLAGAYSGVGSCGANQFAVGLVRNGVPTCAPAVAASNAPSNQFATGISTGGALSYAPAVQASAAPANQFATAMSPAGALVYAQPSFANLTGTAADAQLASAYSGVGSCPANQFAIALSRNGAPVCAPAFAASSATIASSSTPAFDATKLFNNYTFAQNVTSSTLGGMSDSQLWGANLCQNSSGNFSHVWPSVFGQKPAISSVANTCTNALFWNNGGTLRLAAEPHTGSPTVRYVSSRGNDSNDGFTLATAKLTVGATYDSIPNTIGASGATIYVDGSLLTNGGGVAMDSTPGQGLWICGGGDSTCTGTPPAGFRPQKQGVVKLIGLGHSSSPSNTVGGMAVVYGCSATDTTKPVLWWSGASHGLYVENIDFGNGQCAQPVKVGIGSDGNRANSGGNTIQFENVAATANRNSPANGPGIDIGSNVIWLWFNRIACDGNITAPVGSDARACIVENPGAGTASGPVYLTNSTFNGAGGTKFYQGSGGLSVFAENLMMESDGNTLCPPVVWLPNTNFASFAQVRNIQHADCPAANVYPAFENDGTASASNMLVEFAYGQNLYNVAGAATVLNTPSKANTKTPEAAGQLGFWDDSGSAGQNGRISGQHDSARRAFGAVGVPYTNIAKTLPSQWVPVSGSVTTGVTAPNGTTNAATLSTSSGLCDVRPWQNGSFTASAGDGFVAGVWARAHGSWVTGQKIISIGFQTATAAGGNGAGLAPVRGDGEWEWVSTSGKVATGQTNQVANLSLSCDATHPIDFFGPVLLYFPAGAASDNELAYLREHLQSFPDTASVGDVTTLRRTRLSFGVPNADYFGKFTSQPFSQDHIFTWPDQDGSVDTHSLTPLAGNCTTWASGTQTGDYGQPCHAELVNSQSGTSYTVINSDLSKLVTFTNPAAVSITLPQPGYGNFASGWYADFQCQGAGGCTITPGSSTIDAGSSLGLSQGQGVRIVSDGSNYFTMRGIGGGGAVTGSGTSGTIPLWTSTNGQSSSPLSYISPTVTLTAPGNPSLQIKTSSSGTNYPGLQFLDNTGTTKAEVVAGTNGDLYLDMGGTGQNIHFRSSVGGSDMMRLSNSTMVLLEGLQVGSTQGFYVNSAGKLITYGGVNTAGNGMSAFVYSYTTPGPQSAPIGNITMITAGASALYQFTGEINCTLSSSASVTLTLTFTDTSNTTQSLPITANCSALGPSSVADAVHAIRAKAGTSVSWSTSITGTPTYDAEVRLQSM